MKNFDKFIEEASAKRCPKGQYWCYTDKKCKKIPGGYHIGRGGYLEQDGAHSVYGVLLQIEAGDVLDHKIEYDLPASLIANNGSNYRYTLHLQKQPGARNRHIEIQIILPENAVIQNLQPSGIVAVDSILSFVSKLDRDIEIVVDFRK